MEPPTFLPPSKDYIIIPQEPWPVSIVYTTWTDESQNS